MKKRLAGALLALLMLVGCFAMSACSTEETEIDTTGKRISMTLTMWLPCAKDAEVDDEAVANVEKAINEVTQAQYSTAIKLRVLPADEYDTTVLSKLKASRIEEYRQSSMPTDDVLNSGIFQSLPEYTEPEENEFEVMNAAVFASYPSVEKTQFDIFLIHGYDEMVSLADEALVSALDDNLSDESKVLNSYIYPSFFEGSKYYGSTYAVPNNHALGKYELMLVNKEIASALYYDASRFTSVDSLFNYDNSGVSFIADAAAYIAANGVNAGVVAGSYTPPYIKYFNSADDGQFSLVSAFVGSSIEPADVSITNTFRNTNYVNATRNLKRISSEVAPVAFDPSRDYAVAFTEGTAEDIAKYSEKYQVTVLQNPQATKDDICSSMFAVSAYTKDVDRSMEIITLLNTDVNFRTILQYGVEGTHWRKNVDDSNVIDILSDKYKMDIGETGNVYMTYPDAGVPLSYWDYSKQQNLDSFITVTSGFSYNDENTAPLLAELDAASADIKRRVDAMSYEEFTASLEALRSEVDALECVQKLTYVYEDGVESPFALEESISNLWFEFINS